MSRGRIYTVYEKPEASDPAARMVLVREGFAFWALVFNLLWLLTHRLWLPALGYMALCIALAVGAEELGLNKDAIVLLQFLLQLLLAYHAYDLVRWNLVRRGYRFAGVLAGESDMQAQQRYYEFAA